MKLYLKTWLKCTPPSPVAGTEEERFHYAGQKSRFLEIASLLQPEESARSNLVQILEPAWGGRVGSSERFKLFSSLGFTYIVRRKQLCTVVRSYFWEAVHIYPRCHSAHHLLDATLRPAHLACPFQKRWVMETVITKCQKRAEVLCCCIQQRKKLIVLLCSVVAHFWRWENIWKTKATDLK